MPSTSKRCGELAEVNPSNEHDLNSLLLRVPEFCSSVWYKADSRALHKLSSYDTQLHNKQAFINTLEWTHIWLSRRKIIQAAKLKRYTADEHDFMMFCLRVCVCVLQKKNMQMNDRQ